MKILVIPNNTQNNCYGVRNKLPMEFIGHEVRMENGFKSYYDARRGSVLDAEPFDWADIVVFNRHYNIGTNTIKNIINYCRQNGVKTIYETDDLLQGLDNVNPMFQDMQGHISQVRMMASEVDVCTTTGKELQNELLKLNPNVEILPNCVDPKKWKKRKGGKKVRVGWAGGSSHTADMFVIIDVIKELQQELDFEFVIFGLAAKPWDEHVNRLKKRHAEQTKDYPKMKPAPWYEKIVALDEKLKELEWTHEPFVPLPEFNKKLSDINLDIGLCPIVDTKFNRCKSAIKFYEYAMVNTCTVASKIPPYEGEVNCCVKNKHNKWKAKLRLLIQDKKIRDFLTAEQREWVLKNRDIRNNIYKWQKVYSV